MFILESTNEIAIAEQNVANLMDRFGLSYGEARMKYENDFQVSW
ncbi:hypothetical protein SEA_ARCHIMEDES_18 [Gordonia phage Archimedes]|uniref:Uncharacterized protein n=1 Tax=Gordonia phage Archimedes TaxID=2759389 RepID=A0A7L7SKM4_9CAUD|nr:hypothetical protein KCH38_gp18 [Gordonia phage Archimedes]QOC55718.1 hypothetical protein SEA_ARCHIMEDES_18 [Gordonia phage Archimedes]